MLKPPLPKLPEPIKTLALNYASYFKIGGVTFDKLITDGQLVIFSSILFRLNKYLEIICYTQYGKTLDVALATIVTSCIQGKVTCVVAPSKAKAKLTMQYYIEHLGDDPMFYTLLEKNTKLERLRQEESKERIILRNGGGIFCISVDQKNSKKSIEAAMGAGAEIVIMDEAGLVEDDTEATVFRMITGKKSNDKMYCKIGNPFYSSPPNAHFKIDWENPLFANIFIDAAQGIREGRLSIDENEMAKNKPLYSVLFGCEFPLETAFDKNGYQQLVLSDWIKYNEQCREEVLKLIAREKELVELIKKEIDSVKREVLKKELAAIPPTKLGGDIARGKDFNVFIVRKGIFAFVGAVTQTHDTMVNVNTVEDLVADYSINDEDVNLDDTGVGGGVVDRLAELGHNVNGVGFGESPNDKETFANLKAELNWMMMLWIRDQGGQLDPNSNWVQITWSKYKQRTGDRQIIMEPKEKLIARTKKSPDYLDALVLTFYEAGYVGF